MRGGDGGGAGGDGAVGAAAVIGRVYRGVKVGGLVRYLYGPGRHNEHVDQRLVTCWSGSEAQVLAAVEPEWTGGQAGVGERDYRGLIAELEAPAAYAGGMDPNPVWHCPLRTAPGDRVLSDVEWAQVAVDLMHRTGIAPRGDDGGCRWIAVRHDEHSIHVVAVLARQDGARAHVFRDYPQVRATCLAAEARYGLVVTAPADRTAATHTTRAETEKAARAGRVPARDWLRTEVQHAAAASREAGEFLDRLRAVGVAVRERHDPQGRLTGYAVGRVEEPGLAPVLFGGGRLAADLSLPKLQARWAGGGGAPQDQPVGPVTAGSEQADDRVRAQLWERATTAAGDAAEAVLAQHDSDPAAAADAAAAAAEVLAAAGRLIEGTAGGPLTQAARDYDRAARERYGQLPVATAAGGLLRAAALQLARASRRPGRTEAAHVALLITQITRLSLAVARLREAQGRTEQAAAARRATRTMRTAAGHWDSETAQFLAAAQQPSAAATTARAALPAAVTTPNSAAPSPRPAHGPPPGKAVRGL